MRYRRALTEMAASLYTQEQMQFIEGIVSATLLDFPKLRDFDRKLSGPGIHNINDGETGRYKVEDRAIFRPIQYIEFYFQFEPELGGWLTRDIVEMSGSHLEGLLKALIGPRAATWPMGVCLRQAVVVQALGIEWVRVAAALTRIHNDAKHEMDHEKDTHRFTWQEAVISYLVARKLAAPLMQRVHLATPASVWA